MEKSCFTRPCFWSFCADEEESRLTRRRNNSADPLQGSFRMLLATVLIVNTPQRILCVWQTYLKAGWWRAKAVGKYFKKKTWMREPLPMTRSSAKPTRANPKLLETHGKHTWHCGGEQHVHEEQYQARQLVHVVPIRDQIPACRGSQ